MSEQHTHCAAIYDEETDSWRPFHEGTENDCISAAKEYCDAVNAEDVKFVASVEEENNLKNGCVAVLRMGVLRLEDNDGWDWDAIESAWVTLAPAKNPWGSAPVGFDQSDVECPQDLEEDERTFQVPTGFESPCDWVPGQRVIIAWYVYNNPGGAVLFDWKTGKKCYFQCGGERA